MELLANYDDGSSTPKGDRNREESTEKSPKLSDEYRKMMDSRQSDKSLDMPSRPPWAAKSDSHSDSTANDSVSENEAEQKAAAATGRSSLSSESSSLDSPSGSGHSDDDNRKSEKKDVMPTERERKASSSSKVGRRKRSRSGSKGHRRRRSSERHRRSHSQERHHKSSRSERRPSKRSRSRSHSRDRHSRRHSRDHRRREGHRRHRSSSRDGHRHRRRSSPGHRHHHRSRSPVHRKGHHSGEKRYRSRSPRPSGSKVEESATNSSATSTTTASCRPPVYKSAGVKFGRGRGTTFGSSYKDRLKEEYIQQVQQAQNVVDGNGQPMVARPSPMTSSVATLSAGTGVMGPGGMNQVLINQMQQLRNAQNYVPGQPGVLTNEQKAINQRCMLRATGRTREQVEAQYGFKIPEIYNENTNNLVEIAERSRKRSLLWKNPDKKKNEGTSSFNTVPILPGHDKKENLKFARLLGSRKGKPKEEEEQEEQAGVEKSEAEEKAVMENEILNTNLLRQYESSRMFTHFNRGTGLGYPNTVYQPH